MANKVVINETEIAADRIISYSLTTSHALMGESLAADEITIDVETGDRDLAEGFIAKNDNSTLLDADGVLFYSTQTRPIDISAISATNTPMYAYIADEIYGKFFLQSVKQIGKGRYELTGTSAIGLLANSKHYGGIYSNVSAGTILEDILKGFPYWIGAELANISISGYLPIATRRDNLQQVLFVTGADVSIDGNGRLMLDVTQPPIKSSVTASRCYLSGSSVEQDTIPDGVELTEHNYFALEADEEQLFNDAVTGTVTVEFDEPMHSLRIVSDSGTAEIVASGANYATIAANENVELYGQPYTHIQRTVTAGEEDTGYNVIESVSDATLANPLVAQTLATRLLNMSQKKKTMKQDFILSKERAGDYIEMVNPYTLEMEKGTLTGLDVAVSGICKASAEYCIDYQPGGAVAGYEHYILLTGSGRWELPAEAGETIRVILVGGGTGGSGGEPGDDGAKVSDASIIKASSGGNGGSGGDGGSGGKIYEFTLATEDLQDVLYVCGNGGVYGAAGTSSTNPGKGSAGTETIFGSYSSSIGKVYENGYLESKSGFLLGANGNDGASGGNGGSGDEYPATKSIAAYKAPSGGNCGIHRGGKGGIGTFYEEIGGGDVFRIRAGGGGGGGASASADGGNGSDAYYTDGYSLYTGSGGNGGAGLNAPAVSATAYGCGGNGGNGGGGGGGVGGGACSSRLSDPKANAGSPGKGGSGGKGSNGTAGCIIIYY